MVRLIKRLLGIDLLEKRIEELEKSQTSVDSDEKPKMYDDVLDEWMNGKKEGEE